MQLEADDNSRDGLALYWAGKYFQKVNNEHKVLIVVSDGESLDIIGHKFTFFDYPTTEKKTHKASQKNKAISKQKSI